MYVKFKQNKHLKAVPCNTHFEWVQQETRVWALDREDPLEKGMATHSTILACWTPWTEEPGGLQSMESQRVRHDWAHPPTHTHTHTHTLELPGLITGPVLWMSTFSIGVQGEESGMCDPKWGKNSSWVEQLLNGLCSLKIIQGQKEGKSIFW